jgi:hypothetical protein
MTRLCVEVLQREYGWQEENVPGFDVNVRMEVYAKLLERIDNTMQRISLDSSSFVWVR